MKLDVQINYDASLIGYAINLRNVARPILAKCLSLS